MRKLLPIDQWTVSAIPLQSYDHSHYVCCFVEHWNHVLLYSQEIAWMSRYPNCLELMYNDILNDRHSSIYCPRNNQRIVYAYTPFLHTLTDKQYIPFNYDYICKVAANYYLNQS